MTHIAHRNRRARESCAVLLLVACAAPRPQPLADVLPPVRADPSSPPDYGTTALCTPPEEVLYEETAAAFARLTYPTFTGLTSGQVICAFSMAFDGGMPRAQWVAALRERVRYLSKGEVELTEIPPESLSLRVKGRAAYLRLVHRDGSIRTVILGPYRDPIMSFTSE